MTSILDEVQIALAQRKLEKITGNKEKFDAQMIENIRLRFKSYIVGAPNAIEILMAWYKISSEPSYAEIAEEILNQCESIDFFTFDIGGHNLDLIQKPQKSTNPHNRFVNDYFAWAVKFAGVYGEDIYFIPYTDKKNGFACSIIHPGSLTRNQPYERDIPREEAIEWIADYKEAHEKE